MNQFGEDISFFVHFSPSIELKPKNGDLFANLLNEMIDLNETYAGARKIRRDDSSFLSTSLNLRRFDCPNYKCLR